MDDKGSKVMHFKKLLFFLILLLPGVLTGQDKERSSEKENPTLIEVRKAKVGPDGSFVNGSMPDTLMNRYLIDEDGKLFKYFLSYEEALAHYKNGHHPRKKDDAVKGVVYIRKAPHFENGFPDHIKN